MSFPSDISDLPGHLRTYQRSGSVVFLKTNEEFGGLSNMASGYPIVVNGLHINSTEALYQACRFPAQPPVQRLIIAQPNAMAAKMKSKPFRIDTRPDWDAIRVRVMRWCLQVKLAQNWDTFGTLLEATGRLAIVEESRRDGFWGAKALDSDTLVGINVLGRLLMELRDEMRGGPEGFARVVAPPVGLMLDGQEVIEALATDARQPLNTARSPRSHPSRRPARSQMSLANWLLPEGDDEG